MNRNVLKALATALMTLVLAATAAADGQKFPERSLIVNVNNATDDELISLPEIGSELARAIVKKRPYTRVENLLRVKGIGEYTLGTIRPYVKVTGKTEPYKPE